jgi:hypothetical protein
MFALTMANVPQDFMIPSQLLLNPVQLQHLWKRQIAFHAAKAPFQLQRPPQPVAPTKQCNPAPMELLWITLVVLQQMNHSAPNAHQELGSRQRHPLRQTWMGSVQISFGTMRQWTGRMVPARW